MVWHTTAILLNNQVTILRAFQIFCRTIDDYGESVEEAEMPSELGEELAVNMYKKMVMVQTMDTIFYEAQRQVCSLHIVWRQSLKSC